MTDYGVTPDGFVVKPSATIRAEIVAELLATVSPTLDTSPDSPTGQTIDGYIKKLVELWTLGQDVYNSFDRDSAEDASLDNVGKLSGTDRGSARYSLVTCTCNMDNGTTIESGINFASVENHPDIRFTPETDFTATSDGDHFVLFRAELTGPVVALAGTLNVIATAVVGWNHVTNAADAAEGADVESNPDYRTSQEAALAETGSSTLPALRAHLLEDVAGILTCTVLENTTSGTDSNGLPPNSFQALIFDGDTPAASDDDIAQTIWKHRPTGIQSFGSSFGTAIDALGNAQSVFFTRITTVPIYVTMTLSTGAGYDHDATVEALVEAANAQYDESGQTVIALFVQTQPLSQPGVTDVTAFTIGTAPSPTLDANIAISIFQIARFDTSHVTVTP
jgi:hypothetical protein